MRTKADASQSGMRPLGGIALRSFLKPVAPVRLSGENHRRESGKQQPASGSSATASFLSSRTNDEASLMPRLGAHATKFAAPPHNLFGIGWEKNRKSIPIPVPPGSGLTGDSLRRPRLQQPLGFLSDACPKVPPMSRPVNFLFTRAGDPPMAPLHYSRVARSESTGFPALFISYFDNFCCNSLPGQCSQTIPLRKPTPLDLRISHDILCVESDRVRGDVTR